MTTVYLGGPINGCTDSEANGWRQGFMDSLAGCKFLDPMVCLAQIFDLWRRGEPAPTPNPTERGLEDADWSDYDD